MKNIIFVIFVAFAALGSLYAQSAAGAENALIWDSEVYSFGRIQAGKPVTHRFMFLNQSGQDVTISSAQASCGCTRPTWTQAAIPNGEEGYVDATFNAGSMGAFSKTIVVKTNVGYVVTLRLTGEVVMNP